MGHRLYISAPFGNYYRHPAAVSVLGTYTLGRRAGAFRRWWQVLRTLRPYPGGWINQLGLPNPGIDAAPPHAMNHDAVISLHGFDADDWRALLDRAYALGWRAVELNLSCPNVEQARLGEAMQACAYALRLGLDPIAKLGPVRPLEYAEVMGQTGLRRFHLCNTIPTARGGVSGAALKPFALKAVDEVRERFGDDVSIIGGGGVYSVADARDFLVAGANDVAIASALLKPFRARRLVAELVEFLARE